MPSTVTIGRRSCGALKLTWIGGAMPDTPLPEAELKRVEEYCEKATAARHLKSMMEAVYSLPKFDRDFIFAARTDLPALVAEVRRLRADLEHRNTEFRELSDVNDELQADLEQAAKDYVVA